MFAMLEKELPKEIREGINSGEYQEVLDYAREQLAPLSLDDGLDLILEELGRDRLVFDALAATWLAKVIVDLRLDLYAASWTALRLRECRERYGIRNGSEALRRLLVEEP